VIVSVIMGAHNEERRVGNAIRSVQQQAFQDWELVVVDDGSTDRTAEVLEALARQDPRIRVLRNERNLGLAASLNRAIEASKGELIARMDSDDSNLPDRLERQVAFFRDHPEVDVLGGGAIEVNSSGSVLDERHRRETHDEMMVHIYRENPFLHPTVMGRRRFWEMTGGYNPRAWLGEEDYDLWLRARHEFRYHNLQIPLIYYRRRPPSRARALASFRAIWRSVLRERKVPTHGWCAFRPLVALLWFRIRHPRQGVWGDLR
jgi:glycosyltransferase involved in cell wall biosynthesis